MKLKIADDLSLPVDAADADALGLREARLWEVVDRHAFCRAAHRGVSTDRGIGPRRRVVGPQRRATRAPRGRAGGLRLRRSSQDLPLEPTAGALVADTIVDHRIKVFVLREFARISASRPLGSSWRKALKGGTRGAREAQ